MSEPEPGIEVPYELRAGVWANDVDVFGDVEEATLDFIRIDPRDTKSAVVVARGDPVAVVHTDFEIRAGALHMNGKEFRYQTFKRKIRKPTPEQEAILERWRQEVEERVQARLRERYGK